MTVNVAIVADPADAIVSSQPVRWATEELAQALRDRGVSVMHAESRAAAPPGPPNLEP